MKRLTAPLLIATLTLSACGGRFSDSGWNPFGWFGGGSQPRESLAPKEGYAAAGDQRPGLAAVTGASWQPLNEGRLLVVTGMAPTKGYWQADLIPVTPSPAGRFPVDPDGTLHLRLVAWPPSPEDAAARMPASPLSDEITTAITLSNTTLSRLARVTITGAGNTITINR